MATLDENAQLTLASRRGWPEAVEWVVGVQAIVRRMVSRKVEPHGVFGVFSPGEDIQLMLANGRSWPEAVDAELAGRIQPVVGSMGLGRKRGLSGMFGVFSQSVCGYA